MSWDSWLNYAYLCSFVAFSVLRGCIALAQRRNGTATPQLESRASVFFRAAIILIQAALMTFYGYHTMYELFNWVEIFAIPFPLAFRFVALAVTLFSLAGIVWVHAALGRHFSDKLELRESHALVPSGPYRWVRHPLYSFLFLFFISSALLSADALIALCSALLITNIYRRIGKEEEMLKEHFGKDSKCMLLKRRAWCPD